MIRQHKSTLVIDFLDNFAKSHVLERTDIESSEFHSYSHVISTAKLIKYFLFVHLKNFAYHLLTTFILSYRNFCLHSQRSKVEYRGQWWHRYYTFLNWLYFNQTVKAFFFSVDYFMFIASSEIKVSKGIVLLNLSEMWKVNFEFFARVHICCERNCNFFIWFCWKFMWPYW